MASRARTLGAVAGVLLAAAWGLGSSQYRFAEGDDAWQAPLVLHAMDPALLVRDPLITEVGTRYKSMLFPAVAALARFTDLPAAYAAFFVVNRILSVGAFAYLTYALTRSRRAAVLGAFLFTGFGYYSFGTYLGGTPLLEEKLVPRAFAVPAVFMALAAMVAGRHFQILAWLLVVGVVHPVTGVDLLGIYVTYTLLCYPQIAWREFGVSVLIAVAAAAALAYASGAMGQSTSLFLDKRWREIIDPTVGAYVFVLRDTAWAWRAFPMAVLVGAGSSLALAALRGRTCHGSGVAVQGSGKTLSGGTLFPGGGRQPPEDSPLSGGRQPPEEKWARPRPALLPVVYARFLVAGLLAVLMHLVAVDWLGFHPLLEACPERATIAVVAVGGVALVAFLDGLLERPGLLAKLAPCLLIAAVMLRADWRVTAGLFLACLLASVADAERLAALTAGLAALLVAVLAVSRPVSGAATAPPWSRDAWAWTVRGFGQLSALGIEDHAKMNVQLWLREHSGVDDLVLPPVRAARGWQIFSRRACPFNGSFMTYTHLTRDLALRYEQLVTTVVGIRTWADLEADARTTDAVWIVRDRRDGLRTTGAPRPAYAEGPYEVHSLKSSAGR